MKLTRIETVRSTDFPNLLWVRLHTDDGLVGLGETFYVPSAVECVIHDFAAPLLLGQSAFDRERHWQALFSYANFFGHAGAEMRAVSALDLALWDLLGQHTGQPVLNLLGGQTRDSIRVYNTCVDTPRYADQTGFLETPGELAQSLLAQGITAMKIWPWDRFAPQMQVAAVTGPAGWSAVGPVGHDLLPAQLAQGLWTVQEIRRAVGDKMQIALEGHSRWDVNCALRIARAVEPYDILWMEDFMQPDSAPDLARLVRESRVPQTVSERLFTRHGYRPVLDANAAHIIMPDLIWTGGISEALKIATLADTHHLAIAPHDCTGPVNLFACLHLCAAVPNAMIMETVRGFCEGYYREVATPDAPIHEGSARLDQFGPGLGVKLRDDFLGRATTQSRRSRLP
ncbi:MAG: mandelate racemase/muconate lactonizing enzyme family protein [Verrucomicrobia bacterium]|nr:mandelate racemase/muconate lactonizing enzyme family protein [Verrucomicrobiota bacterium]MDA1087347.1 mandelate racemase/muconate lactonizing enzyme family protein [Verrucomicrobiota bacterium]